MGLDFDGSEASWSYSGFHTFRSKLSESSGLGKLEEYEGFGGTKKWDDVNDDIKYLLHHSDCDGCLTVTQMKKIVPRLRAIVNDWDENYYDKGRALQFADDMETCISNKKKIVFC